MICLSRHGGGHDKYLSIKVLSNDRVSIEKVSGSFPDEKEFGAYYGDVCFWKDRSGEFYLTKNLSLMGLKKDKTKFVYRESLFVAKLTIYDAESGNEICVSSKRRFFAELIDSTYDDFQRASENFSYYIASTLLLSGFNGTINGSASL